MQQAPPANFNYGIAGSSDVDWDGGRGRCRGRAGAVAVRGAGNCAMPLPPLKLWMASVTVSPRTEVTCNAPSSYRGLTHPLILTL